MAAAADEAPETTAAADVEMADGAGGEEEEEEGDGPEKGGDFEGETVDLFVLDAHYEPAQVGTVFLIGKVARGREHESACVAVSGVRQTLFFVPKPFVFQDTDGDLQRCALFLPSPCAPPVSGAAAAATHQWMCRVCAETERLFPSAGSRRRRRRTPRSGARCCARCTAAAPHSRPRRASASATTARSSP